MQQNLDAVVAAFDDPFIEVLAFALMPAALNTFR